MAENGTVAYVAVIPACDVHGDHPAVYDASIAIDGRRTWANVCQDVFDRCDGQPGTGRGQKLEVREEES